MPKETRRRLLDAGLEAFGEHGFDAVSTRELAEKAAANQAAIPYHFGGKEGVYLAVAEDLVDMVTGSVGVTAKRIRRRLESGPISLEDGEALIRELIGKMVGLLVGTDRARFRAAFVIRELMHPSKAFDRLYEGYMQQVHTTITRLVAAMLEEDPEVETSIIRAHALIGQIIVFGAGRELIRRRAGWEDLTDDHLEQIALTVTETFLASIRALRGERGLSTN
ncbi:MAG: CerR family C-terminal domain-containing protein [Verrucomicrobiales bacterium]